MSSINAEVQKSGSESSLSTIRKFSRRVQGTGLVKTVRGGRYHTRDASKIVKKKRALKLIKRRAEFKQLVKEGKIAEPQPRTGGSFNNRPAQSGQSGQTEQQSQPRLSDTPIAR